MLTKSQSVFADCIKHTLIKRQIKQLKNKFYLILNTKYYVYQIKNKEKIVKKWMDHFNYNNFYFPYSNIANMNTYMSKQK